MVYLNTYIMDVVIFFIIPFAFIFGYLAYKQRTSDNEMPTNTGTRALVSNPYIGMIIEADDNDWWNDLKLVTCMLG